MLEDYLDKDYECVPKDELDAFAPTLAIVRAVGNNSRVLVALVSNEGYKAALHCVWEIFGRNQK